MLPVKQLLQQLCAEQKDWDDKISDNQRATWERWRNCLHLLTDVRIRRCIRPEDFGEIYKCVTCRRLRGKMGEQRMADLPEERCSEAAPFTYTGVDMFGPFVIKGGRKELKRYGAIFTCLSSRSIHLESTNSFETDSFILALRRFINRRGEVRQMRSDNGTNFVGASKELQKAVKEMDQMKITDFLLQHNTDWLGWEFNTHCESHGRSLGAANSFMSLDPVFSVEQPWSEFK